MERNTDTSLVALKRVCEDLGSTFKEFKDANDERLQAVEAGNDSLAKEIDAKLGKMDGHITKLTKLKSEIEVEQKNLKDRIEEMEARNSQPGKTATDKLNNEYKGVFEGWVRSHGKDLGAEQQMKALEGKMNQALVGERKDVTIGTPSAGGYAVPEEIAREVERLERKLSPVRDLVTVRKAGTSDYKELVDLKGATSGWVGETDARTATNTGTLRERVPTHGELYAYPQVSEWSLDDIFFDVAAWITESVAESFAIDEGDAVIRGNGTKKPTGMLNTAPTSDADAFPPVRNAEAYQFIQANVSPQSDLAPDTLLELLYALNAKYRVNASWIMNSVTTGLVRKLKTSDLQYLWQPGLQAGEPDRLLGYPHATWEQMDDPTNGKHPIGFGNWKRAYILVDRVGLRITRDEVTNPGYVRFYIRRREGGIVLNNDAAKFLRV